MNKSSENRPAKKPVFYAVILMLCAMVWGFAFVSQSVGAEYVGAFTFLTIRCWIAVVLLVPVSAFIYKKRAGGKRTAADEIRENRRAYLMGLCFCGTALFSASAMQQAGIAFTSTAKASFITALYVVLVPVLSVFFGKRPLLKLWICVLVSVLGLYLLCISGPEGAFNKGDAMMIACALLFSIQIMTVSHFVKFTDAVLLSLMQTIGEGILATVFMLLFEKPSYEMIRAAAPALLYAGVMSSGVGYTLQIVGQEGIDPTIASLIMSLESVFGAIGGWMILGQRLSLREFAGCVLMFAAIIYSQVPGRRLRERKAD